MFVFVEVKMKWLQNYINLLQELNWKNGNIYKPLGTTVVRKAETFSPNVYRVFHSKYACEDTFGFVGFKSDI